MKISEEQFEKMSKVADSIPEDHVVAAILEELKNGQNPMMIAGKLVAFMCANGINEDVVITNCMKFINAGLAASIDSIASEIKLTCDEDLAGKVEIRYSKHNMERMREQQ